ncbi:hypothetical protein K2X33_04300 [bacterium]|nr:hypothetical protein [bacterium]
MRVLFLVGLAGLLVGCGKSNLNADFPEAMRGFERKKKNFEQASSAESAYFGAVSAAALSGIDRSSDGTYRPQAGGATDPAVNADMFALDCDFDHAALELRNADPDDRFAIGRKTNPSRQPEMVGAGIACRVLLPAQKLAEGKSLTLPILTRTNQVFLATAACPSEKQGVCLGGGELRLDTSRLFASLSGSASSSYVMVTYSNVRQVNDYRVFVKSGIHPGENKELQKLANRPQSGVSSMLEFVEKVGVADCDMLALAMAQKQEQRNAEPNAPRQTAYIAVGNMGLDIRVIDFTTRNHAWNITSNLKGLRNHDETFPVVPQFEAFYSWENGTDFIAGGKFYEAWEAAGPTPSYRKVKQEDLVSFALSKTPQGDLRGKGIFQASIITRGGDPSYSGYDLGFDKGWLRGTTLGVGRNSRQLGSSYDAKWMRFETVEGYPLGSHASEALQCLMKQREEMAREQGFKLDTHGMHSDIEGDGLAVFGSFHVLPSDAENLKLKVWNRYHHDKKSTRTIGREEFLRSCRDQNVPMDLKTVVSGQVAID